MHQVDQTLQRMRAAVTAIVLLLASICLFDVWIASDSLRARIVYSVLIVAPLAPPFIALLNGRPRAGFWCAFVSLLFLIHGVLLGADASNRVTGIIVMLAAFVLFIGGSMLSRAVSMADQLGAPSPGDGE